MLDEDRVRTAASKAIQFLLAGQNRDGSWPYVPGNQGASEPTSFALLAASDNKSGRASAGERALTWLRNRQRTGISSQEAEPQWMASTCLFALARLNEMPHIRAMLAKRVLTSASLPVADDNDVGRAADKPPDIDGSLRGWSWIDGTFGWVEPTSYALLALRASGYTNHPRVAEGEKLLLDRVCEDGGWNYGNPAQLGVALPSMAPTTALAAMALQGVTAASQKVGRALEYLDREVRIRQSSLSLALSILCFDVFERKLTGATEALLKRQAADGSWRGQVHLTALAVLALQAQGGGKNVFKHG